MVAVITALETAVRAEVEGMVQGQGTQMVGHIGGLGAGVPLMCCSGMAQRGGVEKHRLDIFRKALSGPMFFGRWYPGRAARYPAGL